MGQERFMLNKVSYVENIVENRVFMRLAAPIGFNENEPYSIIGAAFAEEMYYHRSLGREITVKINSGGGNVVDMFSIRDAIITCQAATHNMGLAASAAGILLACGAHGQRTADDISTFMAHPPKGGDPEYVNHIRSQFTREMEKRTKFSTDQITDFFKQGGKNNWFNASDQEKYGVVDRVLKTDAQLPRMEMEQESEETIYRVYNSIINKTKQEMDLKALTETVAVKLGLKKEATETEVTNAADKLAADLSTSQSEVAALKLKNQALEQKITELEASGKTKVANQAKELIENAIKEKKLVVKDDAEKATYVKMATDNFDVTKNLIGALKAPKVSATQIVLGKNVAPKSGEEDQTSFAWLTKHNPAELNRIMTDEPENFERLIAEYEATSTVNL